MRCNVRTCAAKTSLDCAFGVQSQEYGTIEADSLYKVQIWKPRLRSQAKTMNWKYFKINKQIQWIFLRVYMLIA